MATYSETYSTPQKEVEDFVVEKREVEATPGPDCTLLHQSQWGDNEGRNASCIYEHSEGTVD